ncbi:MAG: phosphohistidine phosphatase SixA [Candidatus Binatia bacterium]
MSAVLYLMRHGIAADPTRDTRDADRALTPDGVRKTRRVAMGLRMLGIQPSVILSSPLRRAEETAQIVAQLLSPTPTLELYPPLAAGAEPEAVLKNLRVGRGVQQVLLCGHEPDLGRLGSYLLTGTADLLQMPFKKAGVAAFSVNAIPPRAPALLDWFLTPAQLRAVADSRK